MFEYLQWYFRPRTVYEPERVDYNALNILAEYQVYNLEFAKNQLALNDKQSAALLDMFWKLLEFDPDSQESAEIGGDSLDAPKSQSPGRADNSPKT